jgi:hypothetical protein
VTFGQRGWTPGIALGVVAAAFGLLVLGAWLSTPGTIALASVAIVMTASLLTPTKPLDGGFVASGTAGLAAGLALVGAGVFFVLGVS